MIERLNQIIYGTACKVFGVVKSSPGTIPSSVNPWFKHCIAEYQSLKCAIAQGDTHAACEYLLSCQKALEAMLLQ
jgi:hypothetical protein